MMVVYLNCAKLVKPIIRQIRSNIYYLSQMLEQAMSV